MVNTFALVISTRYGSSSFGTLNVTGQWYFPSGFLKYLSRVRSCRTKWNLACTNWINLYSNPKHLQFEGFSSEGVSFLFLQYQIKHSVVIVLLDLAAYQKNWRKKEQKKKQTGKKKNKENLEERNNVDNIEHCSIWSTDWVFECSVRKTLRQKKHLLAAEGLNFARISQ